MTGFHRHLASLLRSGTAMTAIGTGTYVTYADYQRYRQMAWTFARGNILPPLADSRYEIEYLRREDTERRLASALKPTFSNEYYFVTGEVGCGKTRTVAELVRRMISESGSRDTGAPVYVQAGQGQDFPETLAAAVNFHFDEHINFKFFLDYVMRIHSFPSRDDHHRLTRVLEAIERSAFMYMEQTGRPAVIVIDGVNTLVKHSTATIDKLQQKAKLWADTNIAKVVFVFNDERTEQYLQEQRSDWSRAASPIVIGDLSRDEVRRFLTRPKLMESDVADDHVRFTSAESELIYGLVGGRIYHLVAFKRDREAGKTLAESVEEIQAKELEKFVGVSGSTELPKTMKLLKAAGDKGVLLSDLIAASSERHVATLLRCCIVRIDRRGSGMVASFESKLTENVARSLGGK